jgi:uncharacterized protein (TIGR02266 family)
MTMDYKNWEDRRKYKRYGSDLPAHYNRIGDLATEGDGHVLNVSRGGVFVGTDKPLPVGTTVEFKVKIVTPFGNEQVITSEAQVTWVSTRAGETGMGLNFTKIDRHSQYAMLACAYRGHD